MIVGVTVGVIALIVDGFSLGAMAAHSAESSGAEEAALLASAVGVAAIANSLFGIFTVVLLGLTPIVYGLAITSGDSYPDYVGWLALLTGVLGITTGLIQLFAGFTVFGFLILFTAASVLATVWIVIIGWHQWRKAGALKEEALSVRG